MKSNRTKRVKYNLSCVFQDFGIFIFTIFVILVVALVCCFSLLFLASVCLCFYAVYTPHYMCCICAAHNNNCFVKSVSSVADFIMKVAVSVYTISNSIAVVLPITYHCRQRYIMHFTLCYANCDRQEHHCHHHHNLLILPLRRRNLRPSTFSFLVRHVLLQGRNQ